MQKFKDGELEVVVFASVDELAQQAADDFASASARLLTERDGINVVFSGAESQMKFHKALRSRDDIEWRRIHAFAVDEFCAPDIPAECSVCYQPRRDLYDHVPLASVNVLDYAAADPEAECARYARLVGEHPPDIACLGIGISGHLALNEPGDNVFDEPEPVKIAEVCERSRQQLMKDPNFMQLPAIPDSGITITIPTLMQSPTVLCVVPYRIKAEIIRDFFATGVTTDLPASILKTKPGAVLYLDDESSSLSTLPDDRNHQ